MTIFIREEVCERREVEESNGDFNIKVYQIWDSEVHETDYKTKGELFAAMQKEYGRCTGFIYRDCPVITKKIGWVFEKMVKYQDSKEMYMQETWVTRHRALPTKTIVYHY